MYSKIACSYSEVKHTYIRSMKGDTKLNLQHL